MVWQVVAHRQKIDDDFKLARDMSRVHKIQELYITYHKETSIISGNKKRKSPTRFILNEFSDFLNVHSKVRHDYQSQLEVSVSIRRRCLTFEHYQQLKFTTD